MTLSTLTIYEGEGADPRLKYPASPFPVAERYLFAAVKLAPGTAAVVSLVKLVLSIVESGPGPPPPKYPTLGLVTGKPEVEGDGVDTGGLNLGTALATGLDAASSSRATVKPALGAVDIVSVE